MEVAERTPATEGLPLGLPLSPDRTAEPNGVGARYLAPAGPQRSCGLYQHQRPWLKVQPRTQSATWCG
ncbi:hypothetical protein NDU88_003582 [Pleurodeles waltl]|uniref:Uncharacterized protein n=1 Tax=Pleurodeles waltl TaxID=8319 RepID=A0AAV7M515_PLEWA|nr:hypothetical protein NDU88_003582 [Pleurodeles waltl]